jgi:glycosyltransferase involved in cell wall biosynthesis
MRSQVRALVRAQPGALLAAPPDVLDAFTDLVPEPSRRFVLGDAAAAAAVDAPRGAADAARAMTRTGFAAGRWARARDADLLHGHGLRLTPLFAAASLAGRLPLVITLHNLVPPVVSRPTRVALRIALGRARRVIAVSEAVARSARHVLGGAGAAARRLVVVPNGVDAAERFVPAPRRAACRAALGLEPGHRVALCVARLSPEKDVGGFLEAAALLTATLPEARFLVAGDGPLLPTLRRQVDLLGLNGRAFLLGRRDDVPDLMAAAEVVCVPSREEGLGLAALEAMACALPVVAARVGGLPEVVDEGTTGLLVPPGDPVALAGALGTILVDPVQSAAWGAAGRARVLARFTDARMIAGTEAVYAAAVLNEHGRVR